MNGYVVALVAIVGFGGNALAGDQCFVELVEWDKLPVVQLDCDTGDYVATCNLIAGDEVISVYPSPDYHVDHDTGVEEGVITKYFVSAGDYYDYIDGK